MAEVYIWPEDIVPYKVMFYLQPHVGGSESPVTRTRKTYGLSAPRWIARLTFRGGYAGEPLYGDAAGFGPRLDALIADLEGGLNLVRFHDFRRPYPLMPQDIVDGLVFAAAPDGDDTVKVHGFAPGATAFCVGDYIGGDGRPHLVRAGPDMSGVGTYFADENGSVTLPIRPPLWSAIGEGAACEWPVRGLFELIGEDAGQNETEVGQPTEYVLDFVEKLP